MIDKYWEAIHIVTDFADAYDKELNDRNLLFVCRDGNQLSYLEVAFRANNFMHLTGLTWLPAIRNKDTSNMKGSAEELTDEKKASGFYVRCITHRLKANEIRFHEDGTTQLKLQILPTIVNKILTARMVGDYDSSSKVRLYTEKVAGGVAACVGFVLDKSKGVYIPNTVLNDDIRTVTTNHARVLLIYRKNISDKYYSERVYNAKGVDWNSVQFSEEYAYLPKPT